MYCTIGVIKMAAAKRFKGEEFDNGFHDYKGVRFHNMITCPDNLDAMKTFEVRPDDIFLCTYPKCGTHWSTEIINLILTGGDPDKIDHTRQESALEMTYLKDKTNLKSREKWHRRLSTMEGRRVIMTHLPVFLLPPQVFTKNATVIYVSRNPKDCGVSMFHSSKGNGIQSPGTSWNDFVENWIKQENMLNGSFFDHVLGYWKLRNNSNVLFMKFEDMKKDSRSSVMKFAKHLEISLTDNEVDDVVFNSDVKNMKKTYEKVEKKTKDGVYITKAMGTSPFIRKGQIGDWKNHFTVAQSERFDEVIQQTLEGTGLSFDFE